jgi:hypothetical protein
MRIHLHSLESLPGVMRSGNHESLVVIEPDIDIGSTHGQHRLVGVLPVTFGP